MYLVVIDANVWIKYARNKTIAPLVNRFVTYNLLPVADNYLLSEVFEALVNNSWATTAQAIAIITYIRKIAYTTTARTVYGLSPDPKDNYLFDLAIQNNSPFIITDDTRLLSLTLKPRPIKSCAWFLKNFPVQ